MRLWYTQGKIDINGGRNMKNTVLKLQIKSLEQQLKVLKSNIEPRSSKKISDLYGLFKGQMDFTLDEIKEYEYSVKGNL